MQFCSFFFQNQARVQLDSALLASVGVAVQLDRTYGAIKSP
jgi:hypothetical protein